MNIRYPGMASRALRGLDRALRWIVAASSIVVLPLSLLLFLQWPLRDVVQAYSREANDLAQVLFAVYVSIGVTAATRHHAHLAADAVARGYSNRLRRTLDTVAALTVVAPWTLFVIYAAWPSIAQSALQLERFPDTYNPGYFLLRIAVLLLALMALLQAIVDVFHRDGRATL